MGSAMAANLQGPHALTVHNRTLSKTEPLVNKGATRADTPGAAVGEAVITMLADDAAVEAAVFGPDGILDALAPGAIHISMSTISLALAERLAEAHAKSNQRFVSAPVFGRQHLENAVRAEHRGFDRRIVGEHGDDAFAARRPARRVGASGAFVHERFGLG